MSSRLTRRSGRAQKGPLALVCFAAILGLAACSGLKPVDVEPLYSAGMSYDAVSDVKSLKITPAEVADMAEARAAGFSDPACVEVIKIQRTRNESFDVGSSIAGLLRAGVSERLVLNLERMNELGLEAGEIEAMRLAGLSEDLLLVVARRHAAGQPVLSGAALAGMRNLGLRPATLLQLAERGVTDDQAARIMSMRRRGAKDAEILRQFAGG